jgi:hypothetical protein
MQDDKELSKYTVEEALDLGGIKSPGHYAEGNLGMGVAVLAISKKAFSEQRTEDVARFPHREGDQRRARRPAPRGPE